jgi:hypothetical protein
MNGYKMNSQNKTEQPIPNITKPLSRVSKANAMLAASALIGLSGMNLFTKSFQEKMEPEKRPCIHCGKLKQHNNSFCSAECCKSYRNKTHKQLG